MRRYLSVPLTLAVFVTAATSAVVAQPARPPDGPAAGGLSAGAACPQVLQGKAARAAADQVATALTPQISAFSTSAALQRIQDDLSGRLRLELPSTEYRANQGVIDTIERATVAACFPRLEALLVETGRGGSDYARFVAEQARRRGEQERAQAAEDERFRQAQVQWQRELQERDRQAKLEDQRAAAEREQERQARQNELATSAIQRELDAQQQQRRVEERRRQQEERAKAAAEADERQREAYRKEEAEREAQQRAERERLQREAAEREAEAGKPPNLLLAAYQNYIAVKRCHESRQSYALVYVTAAQLAEAKSHVSAIEAALLALDPNIEKAQVWDKANTRDQTPSNDDVARALYIYFNAGRLTVEAGEYNDTGMSYCSEARMKLKNAFAELKPDATKLKKDF